MSCSVIYKIATCDRKVSGHGRIKCYPCWFLLDASYPWHQHLPYKSSHHKMYVICYCVLHKWGIALYDVTCIVLSYKVKRRHCLFSCSTNCATKCVLTPPFYYLSRAYYVTSYNAKSVGDAGSSEMHFCEWYYCHTIVSPNLLLHQNCTSVGKTKKVTADHDRESNSSWVGVLLYFEMD